MREHSWRRWEIAGLLFTLAAGNLLHFAYKWSGQSTAAAVFSAVNESTWEHMKLLAVPWILWTAVQAVVLRRSGAPVLSARAAGLLAGILAIPLLYYTYSGILGENISLVNITIFQLAVLLAFAVSWYMQKHHCLSAPLWQLAGGIMLVGLAALFVLWTFQPPELPVFIDPRTGLRGHPGRK